MKVISNVLIAIGKTKIVGSLTKIAEHTCGSCEKEFNVEREVEVTYSTSRIDCEENGNEHNYEFDSVFVFKRKFEGKGIWTDLPESEWTYTRTMMCSICGDKEYIKITKDEYLGALAGN